MKGILLLATTPTTQTLSFGESHALHKCMQALSTKGMVPLFDNDGTLAKISDNNL